ncbi:DUF4349 domain-containing protein [Hymenobacter algoricola]|uniref:DUF4349 domain-containing protein n=1 Tax=Hymenobacter algoricola TaxID=486267 RepID=A0ABP7MPV2_9BACT
MKHLFYPVLLGLGLAGCSQAAQEESATPPRLTPEFASPASSGTGTAAAAPGRSVIYHGELKLAVDNFEQAASQTDQLLREHAAYVGTAHETRSEGQHWQEMTIKVPPTEFMPLLQALGRLGRIESKDVTSADVTADVLEAGSRLRARQASESRYQLLRRQAKTPAEIQLLEEQARQARAEIAAAQVQLKDYGRQSTWASLTLRYYQVIAAAEITSPEPPAVPRLLAAFNRGWSVLVAVAVVLTTVWPLLLLGAAGGWLWRRRPHAAA